MIFSNWASDNTENFRIISEFEVFTFLSVFLAV